MPRKRADATAPIGELREPGVLVRRGLGAAASLAVVRALAARQATEPSRGTAIVAAAAPLIG
ncbi:hypothetical protein, partial [Mycolicibacterium madagascariense]